MGNYWLDENNGIHQELTICLPWSYHTAEIMEKIKNGSFEIPRNSKVYSDNLEIGSVAELQLYCDIKECEIHYLATHIRIRFHRGEPQLVFQSYWGA